MGTLGLALAARERPLGALISATRSADLHADAPPVRPTGQLPVHPYSNGVAHEVPFGNETHDREAAVLAVIAIVPHEEIMARGHDSVEIDGVTIGREHDDVLRRADPLEHKLCARKSMISRAGATGFQGNRRPIDR